MTKKKTIDDKKSSHKPADDASADTIANMLNADSDFYRDETDSQSESIEPILDEDLDDEVELNVSKTDEESSHLPEEHQRNYQEQQSKIIALEEALRKEKADFLSACAEAKNIQRRADEAVQKAHKFGNEKLIKELLDVIDSLERALTNASEQDDEGGAGSVTEGVQLTLDLLISVLGKFGVEVVNPEGQPFDPQLHEAMSMQPSDEHSAGTVILIIQKGYTLHGRLIRPARVIVAK